MGQVLANRITYNGSFSLIPTDSSTQPMYLQTRKGLQGQEDMLPLRLPFSGRRLLYPTTLFETPVVCLNPPSFLGQHLPPFRGEVQVAGGPMLHVPSLETVRNTWMNPSPRRCTFLPASGISTLSRDTFPCPSGLTCRLPFNGVSQCQP